MLITINNILVYVERHFNNYLNINGKYHIYHILFIKG